MKKPAFCFASCASIFMLCLASQSSAQVEWFQMVDTTQDVTCVESETYPMTTPEGVTIQIDMRAADDWIANNSPIYSVGWTGEYTSYLMSTSSPVPPPSSGLPTAFILRLYANRSLGAGAGMPGDLITETAVPMDNVHSSFFKTVPNYDRYVHLFNYLATLDRPWTVTKGAIYWLSVQAKFDHDPNDNEEFCGWAWDSTAPGTTPGGNLLDGGHSSDDKGSTWRYPAYMSPNQYAGQHINFAFDLFSSPISVSPATAPANTPTNVSISAAPPVAAPFTAFVIVTLPSGQIISLVPTSGKASRKEAETTISMPCGIKKGLVPLVRNCPALTKPMQVQLFNSPVALAAGTYDVTAGFFDPTKPITSEKDAYILGTQTLVVQ